MTARRERRELTAEEQRDRLRELRRRAQLGGVARARKLKAARGEAPPYAGPFLDFLDAARRGGPSRATWRVFWKAADGLPLDADELAVFRAHTGRATAPTAPARECWLVGGRRGGKSEQLVTRALWRAIGTNWRERLASGEVGVIPLVASDRDQARNSLAYLKGLARTALVAPWVRRVLRDAVELHTGAVVKVATASWRSTRGFTMCDAILEECAFYRSDETSNPDEEILAAIRPALLTVPGARVYGVSSPYARRGILWRAYEAHWGRDSDVLVFCADSLSLNPTLDAAAIAREFTDDPARAASEYGADGLVAFRSDVQGFVTAEAVAGVVVPGRLELPPVTDGRYVAFTDPAGGSGGDSFTVALAHREGERAVMDCVRERRPPFSPAQVVAEYAELLKSYRVTEVVGDRYAGDWPREQFRAHGIEYVSSERTKTDIYREVLPVLNAGRCELLDLPRLRAQLLALERRVARGGRDSIDHPPGGHDDVANAAAGALVQASETGGGHMLLFVGGKILDLDAPGGPRAIRRWDPFMGEFGGEDAW
jgi:hypothetical protein